MTKVTRMHPLKAAADRGVRELHRVTQEIFERQAADRAREEFCARVSNGPLLRGDAAIVLCGEDVDPRLTIAVEVLRSGGAPTLVVTGARHEPPRWIGAEACSERLRGKGVLFDRIVVENASQNTYEQAVAVTAIARERGWARLLLVASPYHQYRAYLTFLAALVAAGDEWPVRIHLVNVPASQSKWSEPPLGMQDTRAALLHTELAKIATYGAQGHVASYREGLDYLTHWEAK